MELLVAVLLVALVGFVIGGLARLAVPGPDPMSIWLTIALGLAGSFVGGVGARLAGLEHGGGLLFAVLGAVLLLVLYRRIVQKRGITGPGARIRS
jgi:uncharacterized membrane protein YeaQ/YmgE (transglycosylase-associated protein family)